MFKLLFIANATRSRSTLRRNMVEYQMVRGVKPRRENLEYSRENSNPFSRLGKSTCPYSANFCDFMSSFAPRCKFFLREVLRSQFRKVVKTTCRILQILQSVNSAKRDSTETTNKGSEFFSGPNRRTKSCRRLQPPRPSRPGCCSC